jgi:hypothetical protein
VSFPLFFSVQCCVAFHMLRSRKALASHPSLARVVFDSSDCAVHVYLHSLLEMVHEAKSLDGTLMVASDRLSIEKRVGV